jgi:acyl-CoA reductase-like NAD-dependent aldehyde dehydrogenase
MELRDLLLMLLGTPPAEAGPLPHPRGEDRLLIDGRLTATPRRLTTINPATGDPLAEVSDADPEHAEAAVSAARRAFDATPWAHDVQFRQACLRQLQSALRDNADEFRAALVYEIGCARRMTYADQYDYAVNKLGFFADLLETFEFREHLAPEPQYGAVLHKSIDRIPVGVVSAITPWNLPVELILAKVGGALAAGCTMVIKPSPLSPWAGTILGRLIAEHTDIPPGVVNVIVSSRIDVAQYLTTAAEIDSVAFTGSTQTGRAVMAAAASGLKRVSLELGGKSASIILDDIDISETVPVVAGMACFNAGQSCIMPSRILVPRERYDEALDAAAFGMSVVPVGDPRSFDTFMGPLVSAAQRDRVQALVDTAPVEGGRIITGGAAIDGPGWFYPPTLVAGVREEATLAREEVFGPVVTVLPYRDVDDAIRLANDSEFGLAGYVWSADTERAAGVARRLRVGMTGINGGMFTGADMPFGGMKSSGMGREWGVAGLEEFLDMRTQAMRVPDPS